MEQDSKYFILNVQIHNSQYKDRLVTFALL